MELQFGRDICSHFSPATTREWLVTNGIGGYACGTIAGVLTRHYHGLLNAALNPPLDRTLLLTKLDETVTYGNHTYELTCDRWSDGSVWPRGYLHIERFELKGTVPTWYYTFADALLTKCVWMEQGSNTTYIRYRLVRGSAGIHLSLKALVNYRNHHHSTHSGDWQMQIESFRSGINVVAIAGATPFYLLSDRGTCTRHHEWYRGYSLAIEQARGIDPYDDHLHASTFDLQLTAGEAVTLVAITELPETIQVDEALTRQHQHEQTLLSRWSAIHSSAVSSVPSELKQLVLAADQFIVSRSLADQSVGKTVIAGYPWFGDWGRDTMIALPGLAIVTGRPEVARPILQTFAKYVDRGMLPNVFPESGTSPGYNTVDAVLWYFEAVWAYFSASCDRQLIEELFPVLADIIQWHQRGTRYNIHLDADGLLYAGESGVQLTWMDAKIGDWVITPRVGKPIEINALWYNALLIMARLAEFLGFSNESYKSLAAQTYKGFQRFWSDSLGYCYDVIDGPDGPDDSLRPNQIFAVALPESDRQPMRPRQSIRQPQLLGSSLLTAAQQTAVVEVVGKHLLTSYGLRSLAPNHPDYCGRYGGNPVERDRTYHQGPVWGWLIGPFVQAHLRVHQEPAIARTFLQPLINHLRDGCIGSVSEIFDGASPHTSRGAFAQAWSVAEVLRAWDLIASFNPAQHP